MPSLPPRTPPEYFRRGKVVKLDPKAGVAHVNLVQVKPATGVSAGAGASQSGDDATNTDGASDVTNTVPVEDADGGGRVFFLLKVSFSSSRFDRMPPSQENPYYSPFKTNSFRKPRDHYCTPFRRVY